MRTPGSEYGRTKAAGEAKARAAFPGAIILRPSIVFGPEDNFFNQFAGLSRLAPALPLIGGGQTKFTPLFVGDLAEAIARLIDKGEASGKTYELGGPEVFSFKQLMEFTLETIGRKRLLVPVPWPIAKVMGTVMGLLPFAPLTADQVELLKTDNVVSEAAAREGRDLAGLGITRSQHSGHCAELSLPLPQGRSVHGAQGNSRIDQAEQEHAEQHAVNHEGQEAHVAHQRHENGDGAQCHEESENRGQHHIQAYGFAGGHGIAEFQHASAGNGRDAQQEGEPCRFRALKAQGRGPPSW